jgi:hypothetical protein
MDKKGREGDASRFRGQSRSQRQQVSDDNLRLLGIEDAEERAGKPLGIFVRLKVLRRAPNDDRHLHEPQPFARGFIRMYLAGAERRGMTAGCDRARHRKHRVTVTGPRQRHA